MADTQSQIFEEQWRIKAPDGVLLPGILKTEEGRGFRRPVVNGNINPQ